MKVAVDYRYLIPLGVRPTEDRGQIKGLGARRVTERDASPEPADEQPEVVREYAADAPWRGPTEDRGEKSGIEPTIAGRLAVAMKSRT